MGTSRLNSGVLSIKFVGEVDRILGICFYNNAADMMAGRMMRFTSAVELLKNEALNTKVVEERAFLEDLAGQPIGPITETFRVSSGKTIFWTMNDVLKERDLKRIEF